MDHIHSSLLIIAFHQAASHSSSSAGRKWTICQAGQLQLNRAWGRGHTATLIWGHRGKEHAAGSYRPGPKSQALQTTWCLQQAAQEPCCPRERGLKVPSEPCSGGPISFLCRERPSPMQQLRNRRPWEAFQHLCPLLQEASGHLVPCTDWLTPS